MGARIVLRMAASFSRTAAGPLAAMAGTCLGMVIVGLLHATTLRFSPSLAAPAPFLLFTAVGCFAQLLLPADRERFLPAPLRLAITPAVFSLFAVSFVYFYFLSAGY